MRYLTNHLFVLLQRLMPKFLLTSLIYRLTRVKTIAVKNFLIRQFVRIYKVEVDDALLSAPEDFADFNAFFTRELSPDARTVDADTNVIVSPADGVVSAAGQIDRDRIFQAKGLHYTLTDLLSTNTDEAEKFIGGCFVTVYLAPRDYHRVHCPYKGALSAVRYVPGELFSVNTATVSLLPNLFVRNERLICHFDCDFGPLVAIMVGALNVGSITTPWTGEIRPESRGVTRDLDPGRFEAETVVKKGDLLGWFNMGSTVILLVPASARATFSNLENGQQLRMGESVAVVQASR